MFDLEGDNWITSKDLLKRTGVSRATLNNYIKAGILPKPVVKKGGLGLKGTKQIGFFPIGVLDRLILVRRLKREGLSMKQIAARCQQIWPGKQDSLDHSEITDETTTNTSAASLSDPGLGESGSTSNTAADTGDGAESTETTVVKPEQRQSAATRNIPPKALEAGRDLSVTLDNITIPAYLINHANEIEWINQQAQDEIFSTTIDVHTNMAARNIFKLLFGWEFHQHVTNWQQIMANHLQMMRPQLSRDQLKNVFYNISEREYLLLDDLYGSLPDAYHDQFCSQRVNFELLDGSFRAYEVYTISFREGLFVAYVPTDQVRHDILQLLGQREQIIHELLSHRMPSLVSLCVLVADLQDSIRLSAELLPAEYFELINSLWRALGDVFTKHHGIYGKHAGDGMLYYFIEKPGVDHIMNAMSCALELRERMKEFSSQWRLRKGWSHDLHLNTGINEGQEFFGTIQCATNIEFSALGDTINNAARLSDFARYGSIWVTKNVIGKLSQDEVRTLRFGVYRQENERKIFVRSTFSRVMDMLDTSHPNYHKLIDIATLPVTEIMGAKGLTRDHTKQDHAREINRTR